MCTLTWRHDDAGYQLAFNRDESRSRSVAQPPRRLGSAILPIDPDGGGTWIAVNEQGRCFALLNAYEFTTGLVVKSKALLTSRGTVIPQLLNAATPQEVTNRLQTLCGPQYAPFRLCVVAPDRAWGVWCWSGERLWQEPAVAPLVSSGVGGKETTRLRTLSFQSFTGPNLAELHRSHWPSKGAQSYCMHRREATTVSLCHVKVDRDRVTLDYQPGNPCENRPWQRTEMDRLTD